jgi:hypothetical protein
MIAGEKPDINAVACSSNETGTFPILQFRFQKTIFGFEYQAASYFCLIDL